MNLIEIPYREPHINEEIEVFIGNISIVGTWRRGNLLNGVKKDLFITNSRVYTRSYLTEHEAVYKIHYKERVAVELKLYKFADGGN